jgi:hypothetical protein
LRISPKNGKEMENLLEVPLQENEDEKEVMNDIMAHTLLRLGYSN